MVYKKGFTVLEIMVVVLILGLLMSTIYIATTPYFKRSRDAARIQDIASYGSIFSAYKQSADTFPTNYGSGGNALQKGYCLSEIFARVDGTKVDERFSTLSAKMTYKGDPLRSYATPIPPCDIPGSYFYSRLDISSNEQLGVIATKVESDSIANLATGAYLWNNSLAEYLFQNNKKGSAPGGDSIYYLPLK